MKQLVRVILGLMGVGLIGWVSLLMLVRSEPLNTPFLIALGADDQTGQYHLYLTALDSDFARPITSGYDDLYHIDGPTPDGWIYFDTDHYWQNPATGLYEDLGGLYRVKLTGGQEQLVIAHPASGAWWGYDAYLSPDGGTLIYSMENATTNRYQLYRANADGTDAHAITPPNWDAWVDAVISDEADTWVIAQVYPNDDGPLMMRIGRNGDAVNLAPDVDVMLFDQYLAETGWVLSFSDGQLWKTRLDGSEQMPIGPNTIRGWTVWLPDGEIIVAASGIPNNSSGMWATPLIGIRLADGTVAWELPASLWGGPSPDGQWIAYATYHAGPPHYTTIERMRLDGTGREVLTRLDVPLHFLTWDEQSLYYITTGYNMGLDLWRLNLTDAPYPERLSTQGIYSVPYLWSDDWRYLLDEHGWVEVATGRRGRILPHDAGAVFAAWANPTERHWSPAGLLIIGSVLTIGVVCADFGHRLNRRGGG